MQNFLNFPKWLTPEIIPGLPFRWYGLMYLIAFAITFILFRYQLKQNKIEKATDDAINFFFWLILALLVGARLFTVIFYSPGGFYLRNPHLIFWPFQNGRFVGIQGMSYHGGLVGVICVGFLYLYLRKRDVLDWTDMMCAAIPLGYTFGRLGNFINAELYGRATAAKIGMLFPTAKRLPVSESWVRDIAEKAGIAIEEGATVINLPRHPSQLYEAFFEGIVLWVFLWFVMRFWRPFRGAIFSAYLIGYGVIRFVIEYFRQPDEALGFIIRFSQKRNPIEQLVSPVNFSLGQIFCFLMIVGGVCCWIGFRNKAKREKIVVKHNA